MARKPRLLNRTAGILLHPTSLPGRHGCGDLGPAGYAFVDFLAAAGQAWWQMLPIGPIGPGNSPYSALSAFAGNPLLISLDRLVDDGLLRKRDAPTQRDATTERVRYATVTRFKLPRLRMAYETFVKGGGLESRPFRTFCAEHGAWLDDHALYSAIRKQRRGKSWTQWPKPLRLRHRDALRRAADDLRSDVDFERFVQYVFDRQWRDLHRYALRRGVGLIGDIPIFVSHDSSDVWAHRDLFDLDARGHAKTVSGVPPDYFSKTGQRWGHPQYNWRRHRATRFAWWIERFAHTFRQFDAVRIDHFLGFNRVWAVPGRAKTARNGRWVKTPGKELFTTVRKRLGRLAIIAEDLGVVVPEAIKLREHFGFPGMRLLHFAFYSDEHDRHNQPHAHPANCVVYPGTHDNETTVGWFRRLRDEARRRRRNADKSLTPFGRVLRYTGTTGREIHWDIIRLAYISPANTTIVPLQDVFGLDNRARMNTPGTTRGNWEWRATTRQITPALARRLRDLAHAYDRCDDPST